MQAFYYHLIFSPQKIKPKTLSNFQPKWTFVSNKNDLVAKGDIRVFTLDIISKNFLKVTEDTSEMHSSENILKLPRF